MDTSTFNVHIIAKSIGYSKSTLFVNFAVIKKPSRKGRPSGLEIDRLIGRHFPSIIPPHTVKQKPTRGCAVCSAHKVRTESRYICVERNVTLCDTPCFEYYHT